MTAVPLTPTLSCSISELLPPPLRDPVLDGLLELLLPTDGEQEWALIVNKVCSLIIFTTLTANISGLTDIVAQIFKVLLKAEITSVNLT